MLAHKRQLHADVPRADDREHCLQPRAWQCVTGVVACCGSPRCSPLAAACDVHVTSRVVSRWFADKLFVGPSPRPATAAGGVGDLEDELEALSTYARVKPPPRALAVLAAKPLRCRRSPAAWRASLFADLQNTRCERGLRERVVGYQPHLRSLHWYVVRRPRPWRACVRRGRGGGVACLMCG